MHCVECGCKISKRVYDFSILNYGYPLCRFHQDWIEEKKDSSTNHALKLYLALRKRGVNAELEKFDGHKHIDIAVVESKINIEVDGKQHRNSKKQALSDLKRTYHSFLKGYYTLRVPNVLVASDLEETADYIFEIVEESKKQQLNSKPKHPKKGLHLK
ncbi:DUF559 domain-containing protein [Flagellimonas onchidii]|uniref:DUF559 domain-containing protein n=1 Tax=Flagellimonas onchidii TaxID=2562684 RepID=UPI0010A609C6|nr:DUF559 domain-containing protein [Allomuricauda onchidii]